jgi:hypothetical protein
MALDSIAELKEEGDAKLADGFLPFVLSCSIM